MYCQCDWRKFASVIGHHNPIFYRLNQLPEWVVVGGIAETSNNQPRTPNIRRTRWDVRWRMAVFGGEDLTVGVAVIFEARYLVA